MIEGIDVRGVARDFCPPSGSLQYGCFALRVSSRNLRSVRMASGCCSHYGLIIDASP